MTSNYRDNNYYSHTPTPRPLSPIFHFHVESGGTRDVSIYNLSDRVDKAALSIRPSSMVSELPHGGPDSGAARRATVRIRAPASLASPLPSFPPPVVVVVVVSYYLETSRLLKYIT
jgi:hypothetical protein